MLKVSLANLWLRKFFWAFVPISILIGVITFLSFKSEYGPAEQALEQKETAQIFSLSAIISEHIQLVCQELLMIIKTRIAENM